MPKTLAALVAFLKEKNFLEDAFPKELLKLNRTLSRLTLDSRNIEPDGVFVALKGEKQDGRSYIHDVLKKGAALVLTEPLSSKREERNYAGYVLEIKNLKKILPQLAIFFYDLEDLNFPIFAVTGTNGKTTVSYLAAQMVSSLNQSSSGWIGTLGASFVLSRKNILDTTPITQLLANTQMTTPDALSLGYVLENFKKKGVLAVSMEASSHALDQDRLAGFPIDTAVFTNLTQDHLDYHENLESYFLAKYKLFEFSSLKTMVLNQDDPKSELIKNKNLNKNIKIITYGLIKKADIFYKKYIPVEGGYDVHVVTPWGEFETFLPLLGEFNLSNYLAACGVLLSLKIDKLNFKLSNFSLENLAQITPYLLPPEGRMELIKKGENRPLIVIDYAHTPDALEKVLKTLRSHLEGAKNKNKNKKLWVVFGCGGDRDRKKRPQMAKISQKFADRIIVTEDNARFETIENIFEDIFSGFDSKLQKSDELGTWPLLIRHRGEAIRFACELAISQDIVLLAGKGHEKYLEVRGQRIAFDERDFIF